MKEEEPVQAAPKHDDWAEDHGHHDDEDEDLIQTQPVQEEKTETKKEEVSVHEQVHQEASEETPETV